MAQGRGDRVVVVSASLEVYLEPWCRKLDLDVVCTRLETCNGHLTGRYLLGDCCGAAKAVRVRERYALSEYDSVWAYGDTEEDRHLLQLAGRKFFRWREVPEMPPACRATRRGDGGI